MHTLNTIAEKIIRRLSGGDIPDDSPYDMAFVRAEVVDALREDLKLEVLQRRGGGEDDRSAVAQMIATYRNVTINVEADTNRVYIDIPSSYMSLKFNKGIHAISPMKDPNNRMIPVSNPSVTSKLQHGDFEKANFGYYVEGQKVYWMRDIKKDGISSVLLKLLVAAPDNWGADDPLPVIPENVARVSDVVANRILNRTQQDRLNDGNPNLRANNA